MRQLIGAILLVIAVVGLITVSFTLYQVDQEEKRLQSDIQYRSTLLAESLRESIEPNFITRSEAGLTQVVERFANRERLTGLAVFDSNGVGIATSSGLPKNTFQSFNLALDVMDEDKARGDFRKLESQSLYVFAVPLRDGQSVVGSLAVIQNADYIDSRLTDVWRRNALRFFTQTVLISVALVLIFYWIVLVPLRQFTEFIRTARATGKPSEPTKLMRYSLFRVLAGEVATIQKSLIEARTRASEEARLRLLKTESPWTEERLKEFVKTIVRDRQIVVVSNREPYIHTKNGNAISYYFPASGMATALEAMMQACKGLWIAHGSGNADRLVVDRNNHVRVPPEEPNYTLRRVWLTEEQEKGYYYGFSNEGMWPLCHIAHVRPTFRASDWEMYKRVNEIFAKAILSEIRHKKRPIIFIQDYHFALLPSLIKKSRPDATIGLFWHIPWPNAEAFSICPFRNEILNGMLGADLIGFHTQLHCNNFVDTVGATLESRIDWEQFAVVRSNHTTSIKPFPISIAYYQKGKSKEDLERVSSESEIRKLFDIKEQFVGVGVERLDYTKGIMERFTAIDLFLERNPKYKKQFVFVQIAAPSRSAIFQYQQLEEKITKEAERINNKYRSNGWTPIRLVKKHHGHKDINDLYKISNICLVTSLHDGMNLVAKEYVSAHDDNRGVLLLSQFTGAARELKDALIINPYNTEEVAEAIKTAIEMSTQEKIKRMKNMRRIISDYNIYRWSGEILETLVNST